MTVEYLWPEFYSHETRQGFTTDDGRNLVGWLNSLSSTGQRCKTTGDVHWRALLLAVGVQYDRDDYSEPKKMGYRFQDN